MSFEDPKLGESGRLKKIDKFAETDSILAGKESDDITASKNEAIIYDPREIKAREAEIGEAEIEGNVSFPPTETIPAKIDDQENKNILPSDRAEENEDLILERQVESRVDEKEKSEKRAFKEAEKKKFEEENKTRIGLRQEKALDDYAKDLIARINLDQSNEKILGKNENVQNYFSGRLFGAEVEGRLRELKARITEMQAKGISETEEGYFKSFEEKKKELDKEKDKIKSLLTELVDQTRREYVEKEKQLESAWGQLRNSKIGKFIKPGENNHDLDFLKKRYDDMAENMALFDMMDHSDKYDIDNLDVKDRKVKTADEMGEKMDALIKEERISEIIARKDAGVPTELDYSEDKRPKSSEKIKKAKQAFKDFAQGKSVPKGSESGNISQRELDSFAKNSIKTSEKYPKKPERNSQIKFAESTRKEIESVDQEIADVQKNIDEINKAISSDKGNKAELRELQDKKIRQERRKRELLFIRDVGFIRILRMHVSGEDHNRWNEIKDKPAAELLKDTDSTLYDVYRLLWQKLTPEIITDDIMEKRKGLDDESNQYLLAFLDPKENETANEWIIRMVKKAREMGQDLDLAKNEYSKKTEERRGLKGLEEDMKEWQVDNGLAVRNNKGEIEPLLSDSKMKVLESINNGTVSATEIKDIRESAYIKYLDEQEREDLKKMHEEGKDSDEIKKFEDKLKEKYKNNVDKFSSDHVQLIMRRFIQEIIKKLKSEDRGELFKLINSNKNTPEIIDFLNLYSNLDEAERNTLKTMREGGKDKDGKEKKLATSAKIREFEIKLKEKYKDRAFQPSVIRNAENFLEIIKKLESGTA